MSNSKHPITHIATPSVIGTPIRIADNDLNRSNDFYRPLIGQEGVIIDLEDDGLYDIALPTYPLLQGLKAERFIVLNSTPSVVTTGDLRGAIEFLGADQVKARKRLFAVQVLVIGIIVVVCGVVWMILKFT